MTWTCVYVAFCVLNEWGKHDGNDGSDSGSVNEIVGGSSSSGVTGGGVGER